MCFKFLSNYWMSSSLEIFPRTNRMSFLGVFESKCEFLKSVSFVINTKSFRSAYCEISLSLVFHLFKIKFTWVEPYPRDSMCLENW